MSLGALGPRDPKDFVTVLRHPHQQSAMEWWSPQGGIPDDSSLGYDEHVPFPVTTFVTDLDGTLLVGNDPCPDGVRRWSGWSIVGLKSLLPPGGPFRVFLRARGVAICETDHQCGGAYATDRHGRALHKSLMAPEVSDAVSCTLVADGQASILLKDPACGLDYVVQGDAPLDPATSWWFRIHDIRMQHGPDPHPGSTLRAGAVGPPLVMAQPPMRFGV